MRDLIDHRAATHPDDAIAGYWALVDRTLERTGAEHYHAAILLMRRLRKLMTTPEQRQGFADRVAALREAHKRRPRLMTMLAKEGW